MYVLCIHKRTDICIMLMKVQNESEIGQGYNTTKEPASHTCDHSLCLNKVRK